MFQFITGPYERHFNIKRMLFPPKPRVKLMLQECVPCRPGERALRGLTLEASLEMLSWVYAWASQRGWGSPMAHTGDAHCWCLWSPVSWGLLCSPTKQGEVCAAPHLLVPREVPCGFMSEVGNLAFLLPFVRGFVRKYSLPGRILSLEQEQGNGLNNW